MIAKKVERSSSTISRELSRNKVNQTYSLSIAQATYRKRKTNYGRKRLLENPELKALVKKLFLQEQWSLEQIDNRIKFEKKAAFTISFTTIYHAIYRGDFNEPNLSRGHRGAVRKLRHKGKTRHTKNHMEKLSIQDIKNNN